MEGIYDSILAFGAGLKLQCLIGLEKWRRDLLKGCISILY